MTGKRPKLNVELERLAQKQDAELLVKPCHCKWCNYRGLVISNRHIYEEYCPNCGLDGYGEAGTPT